jgi:hypothetical protein
MNPNYVAMTRYRSVNVKPKPQPVVVNLSTTHS